MISDSDKQVILECAKKDSLTSVILFGSSVTGANARDIDLGIKGIEPKHFFDFYWEVLQYLVQAHGTRNSWKKL